MFGSFPVGRLFGITVRVHWMWLVLVLLIPLLVDSQPLAALLGFLVLWGIVLLHELGHSLMAWRFGIRTLDITLWPLGGMARMDHIPERPKVEFWIAIAGPLVNFALAAIGAAVLLGLTLTDLDRPLEELSWSPVGVAWGFVVANVLMGAFNLLPAFPMDGGRVLRSILGLFLDWLHATSVAVFIGRLFAFGMIALGVVGLFLEWQQTLWFPLLGVFIWLAGARELISVRLRRAQRDPRFAMFGQRPPFAPPFSPGRAPWDAGAPPPSDGAPTAPREDTGERTSDDPSGARRPFTPPFDDGSGEAGPAARRPLSPEDIERLERYQGRLRPRNDE